MRMVWGMLILTLFAGCGDKPSDSKTIQSQTGPDDRQTLTQKGGFDFRPSERESQFSQRGSQQSKRSVQTIHFQDVAAELGVEHTYENGASPKALMVESTGGGVGWLDVDHDGRPDLYCVQGGAPDAPDPTVRPSDALFRQRIDGRFEKVTGPALPEEHNFGQGVSVTDFNEDGFDDIYVTNVGPNVLLMNQGDGTFTELSDRVVKGKPVWSSSAAWGDIDKDGDLDLYVCNYAIYDPYHPLPCRDENKMPTICHPRHVEAEPDQFYRNNGDGTFTEVSQQLGLYGPGNKALGVVIADFTRDGWPDIYVANDTTANFFFVNNGKGDGFQEMAFGLGGAFSALGETQASMGIAFGDYDENGFSDICLTHFTGESNTLYQNLGARGFQDVSALTGVRELTLPKLGFGTVMMDFNADRCMDQFVTNGHIDPRNSDGDGYEMSAQLTSYDGSRWLDQSKSAGPFFTERRVGRGVAMADMDSDGDIDLAVGHQNSKAVILSNHSQCGHWIQFRLTGTTGNRSAVGTIVTVTWPDGKLVQELPGGTSYASAQQPLLFFGLGEYSGAVDVEVQWLSGKKQNVELSAEDCRHIVSVIEGQGIWIRTEQGRTRKLEI